MYTHYILQGVVRVQERHPLATGSTATVVKVIYSSVCSTFKHQRPNLVANSFDVANLSDSLVGSCWGDYFLSSPLLLTGKCDLGL